MTHCDQSKNTGLYLVVFATDNPSSFNIKKSVKLVLKDLSGYFIMDCLKLVYSLNWALRLLYGNVLLYLEKRGNHIFIYLPVSFFSLCVFLNSSHSLN